MNDSIVPKAKTYCPFLSNGDTQRVTECISESCALWCEGSPYIGYENGDGMCSLKMTAEATAFLAKGDQLKEMGDRELGGRAG